jgi:hypothetical protein
MTNEEIDVIAEQAFDAVKGASDPAYAELDAQAQSMLFDTANAVVSHGGPTTTYELKVAELAATPPVLGTLSSKAKARLDSEEARLKAEREAEDKRIAKWEGKVTNEEKARREAEEDRLDREEEQVKKARGQATQLPAQKGGKLTEDEAKLKRDREKEEDRIAAWKGAVTKDEKERRDEEEERLDKEEDRIKKAKLAQKNGPDKK